MNPQTPAPAVTLATLDAFTRAYLITAMWSSNDNSTPQGGEPFDTNYSLSDLAAETLAKAAADCARFQSENADTLANAIATGEVRCGPDFDATERAGHDFWLTRCGHGAGFWDGDWPEPFADQLTQAAKRFGNVDLYLGDDGEIYSSP